MHDGVVVICSSQVVCSHLIEIVPVFYCERERNMNLNHDNCKIK